MKTWHVIADPAWKGKHPLHDARFVATCDESEIEVTEHEDGEKSWRFKDPENSIICTLPDSPNQKQHACLLASALDLLEACKAAAELLKVARQYFPKSMHNSSKFDLENTNAAVCKAIRKAEGAA